MKMTIGANIKRLRMAKNTTEEQLSVAMNVTCAAVSKWERGETYPDITLIRRRQNLLYGKFCLYW